MRPLLAHLRLELTLLARNGESLLLTLGIPILLLVFFANVDVLPIDGEPIDFLAPGVLWVIALALGWDPSARAGFLAAVVLGTIACAGLGLCLAGSLKALVTLAAANGLYLVLLLLSGMVVPLAELPGPARAVARALPSGALAEAVRGTLTAGTTVPGRAWVVLVVWAVAAPAAATRLFRWE